MTFQQLQYLLEVHRTGSVSRAAENLFVSRSSVSSSISSLEAELGYPIFIRTLQGLTLSPEGKLALTYADRICQTHQMMTQINRTNTKRLMTIAISDYKPVVDAVTQFVKDHADRRDLQFSFPVYPYTDIIDKLAVFELDAAVFCRLGNLQLKIESQLERHGLEWKVIGTAPTVIMLGNQHPLSAKEDLQLRDLDEETFIDTIQGDISKNAFLRANIKLNRDDLLTTNSSALRYELLRNGVGYTVGRIPAPHVIEQYDLRCIPIPELSQPLLFATNPARPMTAEVSYFLELLEASLTNP